MRLLAEGSVGDSNKKQGEGAEAVKDDHAVVVEVAVGGEVEDDSSWKLLGSFQGKGIERKKPNFPKIQLPRAEVIWNAVRRPG